MRVFVFKHEGKKQAHVIEQIEWAEEANDGSVLVFYSGFMATIPAGEIAKKFWKFLTVGNMCPSDEVS
jgi:hypothetical protein